MLAGRPELYTCCMTVSESTSGVLASLSDDLASAVQRAGRGVVAVHGRRRFPASGLAWSADQVVTASHVLERDSDLSITAPDGTQHAARLVGRDPGSDLAVLAVPGAALQPIERTPSGALSAGPPGAGGWPTRLHLNRSPASAPSARSAAPGVPRRADCSRHTSALTWRSARPVRRGAGRRARPRRRHAERPPGWRRPGRHTRGQHRRHRPTHPGRRHTPPRVPGREHPARRAAGAPARAPGHRANRGPDAAWVSSQARPPSAAACSLATSCWPSAAARSRMARRCRWRSGPRRSIGRRRSG